MDFVFTSNRYLYVKSKTWAFELDIPLSGIVNFISWSSDVMRIQLTALEKPKVRRAWTSAGVEQNAKRTTSFSTNNLFEMTRHV